jgi:hypothetical protein
MMKKTKTQINAPTPSTSLKQAILYTQFFNRFFSVVLFEISVELSVIMCFTENHRVSTESHRECEFI